VFVTLAPGETTPWDSLDCAFFLVSRAYLYHTVVHCSVSRSRRRRPLSRLSCAPEGLRCTKRVMRIHLPAHIRDPLLSSISRLEINFDPRVGVQRFKRKQWTWRKDAQYVLLVIVSSGRPGVQQRPAYPCTPLPLTRR
jgi:hypothetical protein